MTSAPATTTASTGGMSGFSAVSPIFAVGSAVTGAISSYYSAKTSKIQFQLQSDLAQMNARMAENTAQSTLLAGQQRIGQMTLRAGQLKSSQRAALAANGVDLGVGNAAETLASTDIMKEIDKNTAEQEALYSAWGYRMQATNYGIEATMAKATGSAINPAVSAGTGLLGSSGQVASSWYRYSQQKG